MFSFCVDEKVEDTIELTLGLLDPTYDTVTPLTSEAIDATFESSRMVARFVPFERGVFDVEVNEISPNLRLISVRSKESYTCTSQIPRG